MHSHPYGEGFGSYFEIFYVFSQRCVCKCFSGDRVFRWPSCRGIDRAMSVGLFRPALIFFQNFDRHFGISEERGGQSRSLNCDAESRFDR